MGRGHSWSIEPPLRLPTADQHQNRRHPPERHERDVIGRAKGRAALPGGAVQKRPERARPFPVGTIPSATGSAGTGTLMTKPAIIEAMPTS